jgi:predicted MPP superfamily phosphohydrolase
MNKYKSIAWATDTHFDMASKKQFKKFLKSANDANADALLITGDIATSKDWHSSLLHIAHELEDIPVFFILGNHDIYGSSIAAEYEKLNNPNDENNNLFALSTMKSPILLNNSTALIGHQNWWDGGHSNNKSNIIDQTFMFQDYSLIQDLMNLPKAEDRFSVLHALSLEASKVIVAKCKNAFLYRDNVILATHVPPFKQNCTTLSLQMTENFLSHFSSKLLGDALLNLMKEYPEKQLLVLSGHTHEETTYSPLHNLKSITAKASLFKPRVHTVLKLKKLFSLSHV